MKLHKILIWILKLLISTFLVYLEILMLCTRICGLQQYMYVQIHVNKMYDNMILKKKTTKLKNKIIIKCLIRYLTLMNYSLIINERIRTDTVINVVIEAVYLLFISYCQQWLYSWYFSSGLGISHSGDNKCSHRYL